jgi:hypothetical protein
VGYALGKSSCPWTSTTDLLGHKDDLPDFVVLGVFEMHTGAILRVTEGVRRWQRCEGARQGDLSFLLHFESVYFSSPGNLFPLICHVQAD